MCTILIYHGYINRAFTVNIKKIVFLVKQDNFLIYYLITLWVSKESHRRFYLKKYLQVLFY